MMDGVATQEILDSWGSGREVVICNGHLEYQLTSTEPDHSHIQSDWQLPEWIFDTRKFDLVASVVSQYKEYSC